MKNLKTIFVASLTLVFAFQISYAQKFDDPAVFLKGDFVLKAGVGLLPTFNSKNISATVPPVSLNVEYRMSEKASIGAFVGYASTMFKSDLPYHAVIPREIESEQYMFGIKLAAHHGLPSTDFYGGFMLGYSTSSVLTNIARSAPDALPEEVTENKSKVLYTAMVGVNQKIAQNLGVFAEVGYGVSILSFGVSYKL